MYEYAGSQHPTRMHRDGLEKSNIQRLMNELFNFADNNFVRSDDRMHAFKLGRPAPKVNECICLVVLLFEYCSLFTDDLPPLLQIGDIDRCSVYVSLAPGMDHPVGVDPLADNAARCLQYTSSDEDQSCPAPTVEERVAGKRPMAVEPSPTEAIPAETAADPSMGQGSTSHAPKHRRLVRIVDDGDEEDETASSLVRRPRSHPDVAPIDTGRVTRDPPAAHNEPIRFGGAEAAATAGRTRRRFFTAAHRSSDL